MDILEFLTKLDSNLNMSLNSFQTLQITSKIDKIKLNALIKKNNANLYKYLETLKQLETQYFSDIKTDIVKPFIFSFDMDSEIYDKNFKDKFKQDNIININTHKLKLHSHAASINESQNITLLDGKDISPNNLNIPVIHNLKEIPPMFHWYNGDKFNKKGIYVCMSKGFYCKVPFPNLLSSMDQNFKVNSIPCKYETKENCIIQKKKISELFNSEVRECSYVHKKEKFVKIGSFYRCNRESFGNYDSLNNDLNFINTSDIKRILMHSLSDSLLSILWYQNKFKNGDLFLNNLEIY
jgi:hypothetical protein